MGKDSGFRSPVFLSDSDEPVCRIRCPVHGFIHFSRNEREIIDHALFRRLRWIKQLALTDYLYPGASHSRFEHSLGVMHVATRVFDALAERHGARLEEVFGSVAELKDDTLAKARQVLRLSALLHDIGHAPFSHAAEGVIHKDFGHEKLSIRIVSKGQLSELLNKTYFEECADLVANIIQGQPKLQPQLQVLKDIVSGEMDADRTDYLLRDSLHCGVEYGSFDHLRMIESLRIIEGDGGTLEMAIDRGGIHTVEALILARYQMNSQVYYHRTRRIYDRYLSEYFKVKGDELFSPTDKVLEHDDVTMMAEIKKDADLDTQAAFWAKRIVQRRHHVEIHATGETTNASDKRHSQEAYDEIVSQYPDINFVWDCTTKPVRIHKLQLPDDMTDGEWVRFPVINRTSTSSLGEQSHILKKVPREFQIARIFADVPSIDVDKRKELESFAANSYRTHGGH